MKKIIVFTLLIYLFLFSNCKKEKESSISKDIYVPVKVITVKESDYQRKIEFSGYLKSFITVRFYSKVPGRVLKVLKKEGDYVKKGDILAIVDPQDYKLQLKQAEAMYLMAKARYSQAKKGILIKDTQTDTNLQLAKRNYFSAIDGYNQAKEVFNKAFLAKKDAFRDYKRFKQLYKAGAISKSQYEKIQLKYNIAKADYLIAKKNLNIAENRKSQAYKSFQLAKTSLISKKINKEDIDIAYANLKSAQAQVDLLKRRLQECYLKSPITGVIVECDTNVGDMVHVGGKKAAYIIKSLDTYIQTYISQDFYPYLNISDKVILHSKALPGKDIIGYIYTIVPASNEMSGNILVKIKIKDKNKSLIPGLLLSGIIKLPKEKSIVVPPYSVLQDRDGNYFVFIQDGKKAKKKIITILYKDEDAVLVNSGLKIGDLLIVEGQQYLQDGSTIKVVK